MMCGASSASRKILLAYDLPMPSDLAQRHFLQFAQVNQVHAPLLAFMNAAGTVVVRGARSRGSMAKVGHSPGTELHPPSTPGADRAAHSGLPFTQVTPVPNRGIVETAILALASWT
jgi:hypothetical protein